MLQGLKLLAKIIELPVVSSINFCSLLVQRCWVQLLILFATGGFCKLSSALRVSPSLYTIGWMSCHIIMLCNIFKALYF